MTQEERDLLIAKVLDAPDALTDQEIDLLTHDRELRETYHTAVLLRSAFARKPAAVRQRGVRLPRWAAAVIVLLCLGAVAATISYRAAGQWGDEPSKLSSISKFSKGDEAPEETLLPDTVCLAEDITFENQPLAEIARQVADTFGLKVLVADKELEPLRLYLTLPKGSTAADFATLIDSYSMLGATVQDGTITIQKALPRK